MCGNTLASNITDAANATEAGQTIAAWIGVMIKNQNILVLGANSEVATQMIRQLATGNQFYLIARDTAKLQAAGASLNIAPPWLASTDFLDIEQTRQHIEQAWQHSGGIDLVIIAHGLLGDQLATEHDYPLAEQVITTNFTCVVSQLITLSNYMRNAGHGKIAVITSVAGDRGRPRNYTYGAAKGALGLYLQGLRSTLWHSGVEIYNFKMGPVDTPMTSSHKKDFSFASAEQVAASMVRILGTKKYTTYVPAFWRPVMWLVRLLPEFIFQRLSFLSGR